MKRIGAGGAAPVVITRTSKEGPPFRRTLLGHPIPVTVAWAEVVNKIEDDQYWVNWIDVDGRKHSMPFEMTNDGVRALIIAMTLS